VRRPDDIDLEREPEDGRVVRARALKVARRAQILVAAKRVFAERGYHTTSLAELLAAADIARGTFYLHFDSKEAAFKAVLDDLLERIKASLHPVDTTSIDKAQRELVDNIARAFELVRADADLGRLLFGQAGAVSAELAQHLDHFFTGVAALAERSLRVGQALGLVKKGDVSLMARLALGLLKEAAASLARPDNDASPKALAHEVLELVLFGVLVRSAPVAQALERG
jgi:AcrR family transcriptional regulator